jgi:hypothetical protein
MEDYGQLKAGLFIADAHRAKKSPQRFSCTTIGTNKKTAET